MATKKTRRRKKTTTRKKRGSAKVSPSLLPALGFLGLAALLIIGLYFFTARKPGLMHSATAPAAVDNSRSHPDTDSKKRTVRPAKLIIYRLAPDFSHTVWTRTACDINLSREEKARLIIRRLSRPGLEDQPPLPAATRLRSISFTAPLITIDLSPAIKNGLINAGTNDELLAVACLVNSLLSNFTDCDTLQILVAGKKVKTLAGHIDIFEPLGFQQFE